MVQGIGKNIMNGIIALIVVLVILAVMIAVPTVCLVYEYGLRSAAHTPFWTGLTYFYAGWLTASITGLVALLRRIF